jgi:transposase
LLKEKVDLLSRRIFGTKSEQLDLTQLELLLKEAESGKADASAEKAEASPIVESSKPAVRRAEKNQRREHWPQELAVEQEVIEPEEVKDNPEAFRCIGEEVTEMLDYQPTKFFAARLSVVNSSGNKNPSWLRSLLHCPKVCSRSGAA